MFGPYEGADYELPVNSTLTSTSKIKNIGSLGVYEIPDVDAPVLALRDLKDKISWAILLQPTKESEDGTITTAYLRNLKILDSTYRGDSHTIEISCDWEWGGKERGLIYLNDDYTFRNFALSW